MSYDIYCYKSQLGRPDLSEAQSVMEEEGETDSLIDPESKSKIVKALLEYNPKLEIFEPDFAEIAKVHKKTLEEAKRLFNYIELNTPEGDLVTQITLSDHHVQIMVPYWYSGKQAAEVFRNIAGYTEVIRNAVGYFVYDPQTDQVFDPLTDTIFGKELYENTTVQVGQGQISTEKKPWWKFW